MITLRGVLSYNTCPIAFTSPFNYLGPVVQSNLSLMSSLVVKMLTVLISTIFNSQVFLLKKCAKLLTFFQQKYLRMCLPAQWLSGRASAL